MGEQVIEPGMVGASDRDSVFARRAGAVFLLFAVLSLVALLIAVGIGPGQADRAAVLLAVVIAVAGGGACYALSAALGLRRPRALAVAVPVLWVVAGAGVLQALADLAVGKLTIPLDAILAAWALSAPDRPRAGFRGVGLVATALAIVLVGPRFAEPVMAVVRRVTATGPADIQLAVRSNCSAPDAPASGPIVVAVEWSWTRTDPFAEHGDAVELTWSEADPIELQEGLVETPPGVAVATWPYDDVPVPDPALAAPVHDGADLPAVRFTLTPSAASAGGSILVPFERASGLPVDMTFAARYAHGMAWRIAALAPCSLPSAP